MYALSTIAMNHRVLVRSFYNHQLPEWETEREIEYRATFSGDTKRWMVAEQILKDLDMEGAYSVGGRLNQSITIIRESPIALKRIAYTPEFQELKIERRNFRASAFLEHMHRRRGYSQKYVTDDLWGICVDLFILSTVLWGASGLWMWWELEETRRWGAICITSGVVLFGFFLLTI